MRYIFIINETTSFIYWLQAIFKWGWFFQKDYSKYYLEKIGELSQVEKKALVRFGVFLNKPENSFKWLWEKYDSGLKQKDFNNQEFVIVYDLFKPKFEKIYQEELPRLLKWKEILESYDFTKLEDFLKTSKNFLVSSFKREEIKVKMIPYGDSGYVIGHSHEDYPDLIILGVSRTDFDNMDRVIGVIVHETLHKYFDFSSAIKEKFFSAYKSIIKGKNIKLKDYKWKHILIETLLTSIASSRLNSCLAEALRVEKQRREQDYISDFDFEKNKYNYGFLIRIVSSRLGKCVKDYFENGKQFDDEFAEIICLKWVELFRNKTI
jgi:hypothetical protein